MKKQRKRIDGVRESDTSHNFKYHTPFGKISKEAKAAIALAFLNL